MRTLAAATCVLALASACTRRVPPPPPPPVAYTIGAPWEAEGVWHYPREDFSLDQTGLADVQQPPHGPLTADNETYDPRSMAAAMASVQLPAIAVVTNLQNGLEVTVRVNDRGPDNPGRLIAVTPCVATLLRMTGPTEVRVRLDPARSLALRRQLQGSEGDLAIATAPRGMVAQQQLAPLPGSRQEAEAGPTARLDAAPDREAVAAQIPLHLPVAVVQAEPNPGPLILDAGTFTHANAADTRQYALLGVGARVIRSSTGRTIDYSVQAGPFSTIADADAALTRAIQLGATDARLAVDLP
jgi:rare lipoprotein A